MASPADRVVRAMTRDGAPDPDPAQASPTDPTPPAGLAQLPGAGPGLLWALDGFNVARCHAGQEGGE